MKGDLRLITDKGYDLTLKNVLYIPGFDKNLLSAMKLVENDNQIVLDSPESGYIKQTSSDHRIHLSRGEHNMLYLNALRMTPNSAYEAAVVEDKASNPPIQNPQGTHSLPTLSVMTRTLMMTKMKTKKLNDPGRHTEMHFSNNTSQNQSTLMKRTENSDTVSPLK